MYIDVHVYIHMLYILIVVFIFRDLVPRCLTTRGRRSRETEVISESSTLVEARAGINVTIQYDTFIVHVHIQGNEPNHVHLYMCMS